jgi:hypothetical protein
MKDVASLYATDIDPFRSISSIQGRPLGFRDETFDVKMPETHPSDIADDEEQFLASFSAAVTQYSIHKYRMDRIVSDIKLHLYHLPNDSSWFPWPANPDSHQLRIKGELERWREAVSHESFNYLGLEQRQRQIWRLKLEILYHTTMVLLFQPSQVIRTPSREALRVCFDNASCIIRDYQLLHDLHGLQHGWRAVQNIFAAGATLIYSFWTSDWVRQQASTTDVSKSLRTCSNLLTIGGEWWPSAKSGQSSLGAVADLTLRKLYIQQIPSKHPRLSHAATPLNEFQIDTRRPFSDESTSALQLAGEGDTTQELGDIALNNHVSAWTRGDSAGVSTANAESWGPEFDMADQARENAQFAPEIESFLADFDKSEFSWSYPLDHTEHHFDMDNFPASGF